MKVALVIPARLASTRLPRKLLLRDTGKPLIQHTYEAALTSRRADCVLVAADDEEMIRTVQAFGGQAVLTSPDCASGTDRVAEVARARPEFDLLVNVQGDEPEIPGSYIDRLIELAMWSFQQRRGPSAPLDLDCPMATLAAPLRSAEALADPACVKVVFAPWGEHGGARAEAGTVQLGRAGQLAVPSAHGGEGGTSAARNHGQGEGADQLGQVGRALYFSRAPIPYAREWRPELLHSQPPLFYQHLGCYAYRREFLLTLAELPPSRLENVERLEQLRVLEAGYGIAVAVVPEPTRGIDTPADYEAFVERCRAR
jgi:3-deoxy-manno-octulosonate cytidylyltransferase (CMP-KDO synthetase)